MDLILPTVCFILYTPNVLFTPFVKNKWYNLIICSLLFIVTLYVLQKLVKFKEGLTTTTVPVKTKGFKGTTKDCDDSKVYAENVLNEMQKLSKEKDMPTPPSTLSKDDKDKIIDYRVKIHGPNLSNALNNITRDVENYSKAVCDVNKEGKSRAKWTPPPVEYVKDFRNLGLKSMENVTIAPNILALYTKTPAPTTSRPTTSRPTTSRPTTARPITSRPTTSRPTTPRPTTARPTTARPINTTIAPQKQKPIIKK